MWYIIADVQSDAHKESKLLYGETLEAAAMKLAAECDVLMQFDLEEMMMDEIEAYYTEGYDDYEALEDAPTEELVSTFRFQCNDGEIRVTVLADSYEALKDAFGGYAAGKPAFRKWTLAADAEEDAKKLAEEWAKLEAAEEDAKFMFFVLQ